MYSRAVTHKIVEYWALGFTAEETRQALIEKYDIHPCLNTIYRHRRSLTAQHLIDELIRQQERSILKAESENREVAMRYRDKLLDKLMPHRIEAYTQQDIRDIKLHIIKVDRELIEHEPSAAVPHARRTD